MTNIETTVPTDTETISASEFKAKCLGILDRLARHELKRVTITKRGQPVAVLTPPERQADAVRGIYGFMRGSVIIAEDVDLTDPVLDEPFTSEDWTPPG
jgi:prevent-host-death family protein